MVIEMIVARSHGVVHEEKRVHDLGRVHSQASQLERGVWHLQNLRDRPRCLRCILLQLYWEKHSDTIVPKKVQPYADAHRTHESAREVRADLVCK